MGIFVLVMMIIANLFANICYAVIVPFLPLEFKKFGLDEQIYGYIFGAYAGAGMIGALFVGKFMAKVGRRVMLVTGMFFLGVSMIAFGFIHYSPNNLVLTIVCLCLRSLEGLSASMISTTCYSIVAITYRRNQLRYLGYLESTIGIGMMIGPFVGSVLYEFFGFDVTFYILGSVFVSVSPFLYFTVPKTVDRLDSLSFSMSLDQEQLESLAPLSEVQNSVDNKINFTMSSGLGTIADASSSTSKIDITKIVHQRKPIKYSKVLTGKIFILTSIAAFLSYYEYCYIEPIMSLRLEDFHLTSIEVGLFFCIFGVMDAFVSLTITFFTNRFDNKLLIVLSLFLCGISNLLVGPSPLLPDSFALMCVGQFLNGLFANFFCITSFSVLITDACERFPKRKNEVTDISSGIFTCMTTFGETVGPIYGSNIATIIGFRWCADTIAYTLVAYSLIFLIIWKLC